MINLTGRVAQELFWICWLKLHHRLYILIQVLSHRLSRDQQEELQTSVAIFQTRKRLTIITIYHLNIAEIEGFSDTTFLE
jgi:hypothetical protein